MESDRGGHTVDPRWYPAGDTGEWERLTRQTIFDSVQRCVSHALYASLSDDVHPRALHASDAVFRELHICTQGYARGLVALGQTPEQASRLIIAAAREAALPAELHPSIVAAISAWTREACTPDD